MSNQAILKSCQHHYPYKLNYLQYPYLYGGIEEIFERCNSSLNVFRDISVILKYFWLISVSKTICQKKSQDTSYYK